MIFVASPYSHHDPVIRRTRFLLVRDFVAHLLTSQSMIAFSPVVYGHEIASNYPGVPTDAQFWLHFNTNMLRRAESLFLLKIRGWEESKGVKVELNLARALLIPVIEFDENFNNLSELQAKFLS